MQPFDFMLKTHRRWRAQVRHNLMGAALSESMSERFESDRAYDRAEAKYFLTAMAPFMLLALSDQLSWPRGVAYSSWALMSAVWATIVLGALAKTIFGVVCEVLGRHNEARGGTRRRDT